MRFSPNFLVVDDDDDNRFLLTKTLLRNFPRCRIHESRDSDSVLRIAQEFELGCAVIHRAADMDGITLIRQVREAAPNLPILALSGFDRREESLRAGATAFLHYDAWLTVGRAVEDLLRSTDTRAPFQGLGASDEEPSGAAR